MKNKRKFYRYRLSWSSAPSDWKTVRIPEGYEAKDYFDEMSREYSYSEHFNGVEWNGNPVALVRFG